MGQSNTITDSLLYSAVLENPEEDTVRLIYADYLDEEKRHMEAEFIRSQIASGQVIGLIRDPEFLGKYILEHVNGDYDALLPDDTWAYVKKLTKPFRPIAYSVSRGMVSEIAMATGEFLKSAKAMFRRFPIQSVILVDKIPSFHQESYYRWFLDGRDEDELPMGIWDCCYNKDAYYRGQLEHKSIKDAIDTLSRGCVKYGRNLARSPD